MPGGARFACLVLLALATLVAADDPWHVRDAGFAACKDARPVRKVRVAVIDDGFRLQDPVLAPFFRGGLDLADGDPSPGIPRGAEAIFWHGTYLSGVIVDVFQRCFGARAPQALEILPIKVVEDRDPQLRFDRGYAALEGLARNPPDVVVLAWSGGKPPDSAVASIARLRQHGTMIFASAGNRGTGEPVAPASLPGVIAVGEIDSSGARPWRANHGRHVLLLGPGKGVVGRASKEDRWIALDEGASSAAAAWVAALYGTALARSTDKPANVLAAMVSSANPPGENWDRPGLGGAGLAQLPRGMAGSQEALWGLLRPGPKTRVLSTSRADALGILLRPEPGCDGLEVVATSLEAGRQTLEIAGSRLDSLLIPSRSVSVLARGGGSSCLVRWGFLLEDSSSVFCSGERLFTGDSGSIEDGSGRSPYANRADCRFHVKVQKDRWIRLEFDSLHTQKGVDFLHVFAGDERRQDLLQAMYSGDSLPAPLVVPGPEALLWFVTDDSNRGRGFSLRWRSVAGRPPLVAPPLQKRDDPASQ